MKKLKSHEFKIESKPGAGASGAGSPGRAAFGLNILDTKFDILKDI